MAITTPSAKQRKGPIILDGYDTAKTGRYYVGRALKQTIQAVGNFSAKYTSSC